VVSSFTNCASFPKRFGTPVEEPDDPDDPEVDPDELEFVDPDEEPEEFVDEPELDELEDEFEFPVDAELAGEAE
jgi:hypothetical protein